MGATKRVLQFIEYKGITKYKFCKDLGFSNKFLDNSSNMGTDNACKILHYFPELSAEWLITGNGEMLRNEMKKEVVNANDSDLVDVLKSQIKDKEEKESLYNDKISSQSKQIEELLNRVALLEQENTAFQTGSQDRAVG